MTAFDGAREDMLSDEPRSLRIDRLARMAEADNWLHADPTYRRRTSRAWLYVEALLGLIGIAVIALSLGLLGVGFGL